MVDFRFISVGRAKINSKFNNARISNVSINSCTIMKRIYKFFKLDSLNKKLDDKKEKVEALTAENEELKQKINDKKIESAVAYNTFISSVQEVEDKEAKDELLREQTQEQDDINYGIEQMNKQIEKNEKAIRKEQNKINLIEEVRQEKEIEDKVNDEPVETEGGVQIEEPQIETETEGGTQIEEPQIETETEGGTQIEEPVETVEEVDPIENLQTAFNNFIYQLKEERIKNKQVSIKNEELTKENEELKVTNEDLKNKNSILTDENTQLKEERKGLEQIAEKLTQDVQNKVEEANGKIREQNSKIRMLNEKLVALKKENETLKVEKDNINFRLTSKEEELERVNTQFDRYKQAISEISMGTSNMDVEETAELEEPGKQKIKE